MSKLSTRLRSLSSFTGSVSSPHVSKSLLEYADEAERLEREVAELRNDLQRVECLYRELLAACEIAKATCSPHGLSVLNAAMAKRGAT
jgi:hypothetical protein